jgi:hypothetical protein
MQPNAALIEILKQTGELDYAEPSADRRLNYVGVLDNDAIARCDPPVFFSAECLASGAGELVFIAVQARLVGLSVVAEAASYA